MPRSRAPHAMPRPTGSEVETRWGGAGPRSEPTFFFPPHDRAKTHCPKDIEGKEKKADRTCSCHHHHVFVNNSR